LKETTRRLFWFVAIYIMSFAAFAAAVYALRAIGR